MKKIIIAIDGHSSTGKSTLAKQLAEHLDYIYIDSGAMYRAVTLYAIENGFIGSDGFDKIRLIQSLSGLHIAFKKVIFKKLQNPFSHSKMIFKKIVVTMSHCF